MIYFNLRGAQKNRKKGQHNNVGEQPRLYHIL